MKDVLPCVGLPCPYGLFAVTLVRNSQLLATLGAA